ncbi:hypothetical protein EG328_006756 [Venturia inaequalis]|uniref:Uncharacterized protein n=1 Tax=Venturia inaequalis TaxID=5025 RepID=A0A8H3ZB44_VENIN|nr:hypothetical protein EG328_006756 [Venturia inaequalis]
MESLVSKETQLPVQELALSQEASLISSQVDFASMKLNAALIGLMALISSAVPIKQTSSRAVASHEGQCNDTSIRIVSSMHAIPAADSYAYNEITSRDSDINPPFLACIDLYEKPNLDAAGPKLLGTCSSSIACQTIVDPKKSMARQILRTIGSIRMEGNTTCGVYESDNCQEGTLRETISEKNMLSWPPVIPIVEMKVAVMQVALTVLGLVSSSFAAPAVDGVSNQLSSRNEPACIDMWQEPGQKTPIRLNYCIPQDQCIPWKQYYDAESQRGDIGSMDFKGTCCQLFAHDDCNASTGSNDYFVSCTPGNVPPEWRSKVNSIQCYLPGRFNWGWHHKRNEVHAAGAVPPLRFRYTTFEGHTIYLFPSKRENPVSHTSQPTILTTVSDVSYITPTSTFLDITISNTGRPVAPSVTSNAHHSNVLRDHIVSNLVGPPFLNITGSLSHHKPTTTMFNITGSLSHHKPTTTMFNITGSLIHHKPSTTIFNITVSSLSQAHGPSATNSSDYLPNVKRKHTVSNTGDPPMFNTTNPPSTFFGITISNTGRPDGPPTTLPAITISNTGRPDGPPTTLPDITISNTGRPDGPPTTLPDITISNTGRPDGPPTTLPAITISNTGRPDGPPTTLPAITISNTGRPDGPPTTISIPLLTNAKRNHYSTSTIYDLVTSGTVVVTHTVRVGFSAIHTVPDCTAPASTVTVTETETKTMHAAEILKRATTTTLPWNLLPTSGWLSGSGSPIIWSTSNFDLTGGVSSVITAPTFTADSSTV